MAREYEIQNASGCCGKCGRELAGGEEFTAALFEAEDGFRRQDLCMSCLQAAGDEVTGAYSVWQSRVPTPEQPKNRFVGDEVLIDFFEKLRDSEEATKINFRFVLALMLMRKKLLVYDGSRRDDDGGEVWTMHFRKQDTPVEVIHPEMGPGQIAAVTAELGSIFEDES